METEIEYRKRNDHGANVRRWREWRGIKQDVLAETIGVSQGTLSQYEKKSKLEPEVLEKLAQALNIPVEAITELEEGANINIFSGPCNDNAIREFHRPRSFHGNGNINNYVFNPIEKVVELFEQKEALYERMLKEKESTIVMLHEIVKDKL